MPVQTPKIVYRKYVTDGVPDSGKHDPSKSEIVQLLDQLFGTSRGGWVVAKTEADLLLVTPDNETDGGVVLTGVGAGYYSRVDEEWERERGLPDTAARLVDVGGTANAITASTEGGVDPAVAVMLFLTPELEPSGPTTLAVNGGTSMPLLTFDGEELEAGFVLVGTTVPIYDTGTEYRLMLDHRWQTLSVQTFAARDKAEEWADKAEDAPVEPGQYSARHHAIKAAASAGSASTDAGTASSAAGTATGAAGTAVAAKVAAETLYGDLEAVAQAKADAIAAAEAAGVDHWEDTKADAISGLGGYAEGDVIGVFADESKNGSQVFYRVESGVLVEKIDAEERTRAAISYSNIGRRRQLLDIMTPAMRDDVMSGAPVLDHTAAVAAFVNDSARGTLWFPQGGVLNVDTIPLLGERTYAFENCEVKRRSAGPFAFFYSQFAGTPGYGEHDNVTIEGGTFDQNDMETHFSIFRGIYLSNSRLNHMTIRHRNNVNFYVTADAGTDTLTTTGPSVPFVEDDYVALFTTGTRPGGIGGSSYRATNVNVGAGTFQLKPTGGGSPIDITSAGSGDHWVSYYGAWGMQIGGRDIQVVAPRVDNGTCLYQDGVHICHGDNIGVSGGIVYSGDDAYPVGGESTDPEISETTIQNVGLSNCIGHSRMGWLLKAYTTDSDYTVKHVGVHGLIGSGGQLRNGGVDIHDFTNTDVRSQPALVEDIEVDGLQMRVGTVERVQEVNPYAVWINSAKNVRVKGRVYMSDFSPMVPGRIDKSNGVDVSMVGFETNGAVGLDVVNSRLVDFSGAISGGTGSHIRVTNSDLRLVNPVFRGIAAEQVAIEVLDTTSLVEWDRRFFGVGDLTAMDGPPAIGAIGGGRGNAWLLSESVFYEKVSAELVQPDGWQAADIYLIWTNAGAGAGDAVLHCTYRFVLKDGGLLDASDVTLIDGPVTVPAQDTTKRTLIGTAVFPSSPFIGRLGIARRGTNGSDTVDNDIAILGVELERRS